jgi:iron complex outermembrane receptor protein
MLTDNRIAAVPSLRVNVPYFIPLVNDDIERIEVVRGPGSALYGPNASNGVLNIITRSPFASKGTSVSVTGGERSLFQGTFRHAGVIEEDIGFKISGQYFRGDDWPYIDPVEATDRLEAIQDGAREDTLRIGKREPLVERFGGEARFDFHLTSKLAANATIGINQTRRSIELTDIGAAQARNWRYTYYQGRITYGDLFLQAFLNQSDAGETYLLRSGERVVDRSKQFVAQAQHAYSFGQTQRLTYGADLLLTRPVTDGTITGRNEESDNVNEYGGYLQSETSLFQDKVNLVLAGRIDKHSELNDLIFSPRAAVVYEPWENQNFRVTFNRAYNTPTTNELFLDILSSSNVFVEFPPEFAVALRASGVPSGGLNFRRDENGRPFFHSSFSQDRSMAIPVDAVAVMWPAVVAILDAQGKDISQIPAPTPADVSAVMAILNVETPGFDPVAGPVDIAPLEPTITQTIELGYKGIIAQKFQAAVDVYYSRVTNFIGPFQIFTPNVFLHPQDLTTYLQPYLEDSLAALCAGAISQIPLGTVTPEEAPDPTAILLAPRNYGKVNVAGMDLSLQYHLSNQVSVAGTYSYVNRNFFENLDRIADLALNAPRHKGSITLKYRNPELGLSTELRNRWTDGFRMSSGVYVGTLHSYSLVDASVSYAIPRFAGATFTLSAINVLDKKHQEFIGAPAIGRLVMGRVQYSF